MNDDREVIVMHDCSKEMRVSFQGEDYCARCFDAGVRYQYCERVSIAKYRGVSRVV